MIYYIEVPFKAGSTVHCRKINNLFVQAIETGRKKESLCQIYLTCFVASERKVKNNCNILLKKLNRNRCTVEFVYSEVQGTLDLSSL